MVIIGGAPQLCSIPLLCEARDGDHKPPVSIKKIRYVYRDIKSTANSEDIRLSPPILHSTHE